MKKLILFLIILLFTCSCSDTNTNPRETVTAALDYYKAQDFKNFSELLTVFPNVINLPQSGKAEGVIKLHTDIKYEILDEKISGNDAQVLVKISSIDMYELLLAYINNMMVVEIGEGQSKEDAQSKADDLLISLGAEPDAKMTENEIIINLTKKGNKWLIVPDAYFTGALTGFQNGPPQ